MIISRSDFDALLQARHAAPHALLGMHPTVYDGKKGVIVRALLRDVTSCTVMDVAGGEGWSMTKLADEGFYEVFIARRPEIFRYQLRVITASGEMRQFFDPYSFLPTLGSEDLYLFNEGNEHRIYEKLGAHLRTVDGVKGVSFAVWAPNAVQVSLAGNFNHWISRYHPMRTLGASGVWELFVPGLGEGELYKFYIRDQQGHVLSKTDPYGTYFEAPPNNASIVCNPSTYVWHDAGWMSRRKAAAGQLDQPMSIYEVHLGSWRRKAEDPDAPLSYRELAPMLARYVKEMGFTHIEIMPPAEYPFDGSWGYQVTGFFAPTHRFGRPQDFAWFVDHLHQHGIGVLVDWVPAHFPRDAFALANFDGTHLYEHADPRQGAHMDWGTLIFNYGRNEVRGFLIASALAWLERYHIDGLRVDAVASMLYLDYSRKEGEWVPNRFGGRENLEAISFLKQINDLVHHYYPGVLMIAEESTSFPAVSRPTAQGGLGFDYKWNMGMMHDTLRYFAEESVNRKWHQHDLTFGMLYHYSENFITVFSHDEVVHGKGSMLFKMGAWHIPEKAANLRALYAHIWAYPGKKLLFMGSEFGQSREWNHAASLDWHLCQYPDHEGMRILVRDLNRLYTSEPALSSTDFNPHVFRWISADDANSNVISYLRWEPSEQTFFLVIGHFSGVARTDYRIGVPRAGVWNEALNSNSEFYGGNGLGNAGERTADAFPMHGFEHSLMLTLPALSTLIFKWKA